MNAALGTAGVALGLAASLLGVLTLAVGLRSRRPALLRVGRPEALAVSIGGRTLPPVGPPGRPIGNVSLAPADLSARAQGASPPGPGSAPPAR